MVTEQQVKNNWPEVKSEVKEKTVIYHPDYLSTKDQLRVERDQFKTYGSELFENNKKAVELLDEVWVFVVDKTTSTFPEWQAVSQKFQQARALLLNKEIPDGPDQTDQPR